MSFVRKLTNLLLYSSVFIALGAVGLVQLNMELVSLNWGIDTFTIFIFFSTIALYNAHRVIGIEKVKAFQHEGRFYVIKQYRSHIILYGIIGFVGSVIVFFLLPRNVQLLLIVPAILSTLYVLPAFGSGKRLRDFHLIKIFTVGFVWAWLTSLIPEYLIHQSFQSEMVISFTERFLFFLAITIPFDIRDMRVDKDSQVKTIPSLIGIRNSKLLAIGCLILHFVFVQYLSAIGYFPDDIIAPYIILCAITMLLIWGSKPGADDHYYSGLLDGTMILQWVIVSGWLAI